MDLLPCFLIAVFKYQYDFVRIIRNAFFGRRHVQLVRYGLRIIHGSVILVLMFEKDDRFRLFLFDFLVFVIQLFRYIFYGQLFQG